MLKYDNLGDRMKEYEAIETTRTLMQSEYPVVIRIDGRGFSKYTGGMNKPYDVDMQSAMIYATKKLFRDFKISIAFIQSDEINLVMTGSNALDIFDGKIHKLTSVLASFVGSAFQFKITHRNERIPHFDCRVFNVPNEMEAANAMAWRSMDAQRNAISSLCRMYYTTTEMHGKNQYEMLDMIKRSGVDYDDYANNFKYGIWLQNKVIIKTLSDDERKKIPAKHQAKTNLTYERKEICNLYIQRFQNVKNKVGVIFNAEDPVFI